MISAMRFKGISAAILLVGLVTAWVSAAADDKPADADKAALQGTWRAVTSEMDGQKQDEADVKEHTLVFDGDSLVINKSGEMVMKGKVTVDAAQKPGHIDFKLEENPANPDDVGKTLAGIYEVKGDDLKWCFILPDRSERPKEFKSESGSGQINATLKREKK
jgi:uncharacterized protein (TIGR03067 family)